MSNVFSFTGTVGRDAEVNQLASGQSVLNVTVANNIGFGDKEQTLWVRVAVWGKRAEGQLVGYLKKGQQVFVSGELSQREYQANDGTTRTSLELNCNVIDLVGKRNEGGPAAAAPQQRQQAAPQRATSAQITAPQKQEPTSFKDFDDVPF